MRQTNKSGRLPILVVVFVCVVIAVVMHTNQLIIPLFLGLLTWGKAWIKELTPKIGLLFMKNSASIQSRRMLMQASTHILVKSHKPWRRRITAFRLSATAFFSGVLARYLRMPLWLRTLIAIGLFLITAGSSFAVFALLIIPQPVLNWLEQRVKVTLRKLGVTKVFSTLWTHIIPERIRHQWHMYVKWTLGRRQVTAAKRIHENVFSTSAKAAESDKPW